MKSEYDVIIEPIITEKAEKVREQDKYIFKVRLDASKITIKKAVEKIFKVNVTKVNVIRMKGKTMRRGFRNTFKSPDFKKAIVTLKKGQKIDFFEGI